MDTIYEQCKLLMSYPVGKIFTSDTPNKSEKKAELRCTKIVDGFYKISSPTHNKIRQTISEIESSLLLMCNDTPLTDLFINLAKLTKLYEEHRKVIIASIKAEPTLKEYYKGLGKADWFGTILNEIKNSSEIYGFDVDIVQLKGVYSNELKKKGE